MTDQKNIKEFILFLTKIKEAASEFVANLEEINKEYSRKLLAPKKKQIPLVTSLSKETPLKIKPKKTTKKQTQSKVKKEGVPKTEWDKISKYLKDNGKEDTDIERFQVLSDKHYPVIQGEWKKSERKPEEYVRMILAAEMETTKGEDRVDYEEVPELELEKVKPKEEELVEPPDKGSGRRKTAGDSGFQQRHLDLFFDKWWGANSEGRDKAVSHATYMRLVRSGEYKPQDLFEKPELVGKKEEGNEK